MPDPPSPQSPSPQSPSALLPQSRSSTLTTSTSRRRLLLNVVVCIIAPTFLYFMVQEGKMTLPIYGGRRVLVMPRVAVLQPHNHARSYIGNMTEKYSRYQVMEEEEDEEEMITIDETQGEEAGEGGHQQKEGAPPALSSAGAVPETTAYQKTLILTYAWGSLGGEMLDMFIKSLRWTGSDADVVIFTHDIHISDDMRSFLRESSVEVRQVPEEVIQSSRTFQQRVYMYARFVAWADYVRHLRQQHSGTSANYTHVMTTDLDVFFQQDPGSCFPREPMLQTFEENQAVLLQDCSTHQGWITGCPNARGRHGADMWDRIKGFGRICAGVIYGDLASMGTMLDVMSEEIDRVTCNDQGTLNMLVWDGIFTSSDDGTPGGRPLIDKVSVFNAFLGPVKTTDVGFYRDEYGYALTNTGRRYCMLHQFKSERNKEFVDQLWRLITPSDTTPTLTADPAAPPPINPAVRPVYAGVELMQVHDTRFRNGLHPGVEKMREKGMTWPDLPRDRASWEDSPWGTSKVFVADATERQQQQGEDKEEGGEEGKPPEEGGGGGGAGAGSSETGGQR